MSEVARLSHAQTRHNEGCLWRGCPCDGQGGSHKHGGKHDHWSTRQEGKTKVMRRYRLFVASSSWGVRRS